MFAGVTPKERRRGQSRRCNGPNLIGPHKGDNQIRRQRLARTRPRRADLIVNAIWRESGKADRAEPPASETAAASADRPTAAIPAEIIGYSMPNISEILVCSMTDRLPCLPPGICVSSHGLSYETPPDPDFRCGIADSELIS